MILLKFRTFLLPLLYFIVQLLPSVCFSKNYLGFNKHKNTVNQQNQLITSFHHDTVLHQLNERILNPYRLHQGRSFFCWSAIPIVYLLEHYPDKMKDAIWGLYHEGKFNYTHGTQTIEWKLSERAQGAIGSKTMNKKNNELNGRIVDQMVFMSFAEQYKCWFNLDRRYNAWDQINPFYAGASLRKAANIWKAFGIETYVQGHDFFWIKSNKWKICKQFIEEGFQIELYINGLTFTNKKIMPIFPSMPFFPTHFVWLKSIEEVDHRLKIVFWDRDGFQTLTMSETRFNWAVFGVVAFKE